MTSSLRLHVGSVPGMAEHAHPISPEDFRDIGGAFSATDGVTSKASCARFL